MIQGGTEKNILSYRAVIVENMHISLDIFNQCKLLFNSR